MSPEPSPEQSEILAAMRQVYARSLAGGSAQRAGTSQDAAYHGAPPVDPELGTARHLLATQYDVGDARLKSVKKVVLRGSRLFTHRLVGASQHLSNAVEGLDAQMEQLQNSVTAHLSSADLAIGELREQLAQAHATIDTLQARTATLTGALVELERSLAYSKAEVQRTRALARRARPAVAATDAVPDSAPAAAPAASDDGVDEQTYLAFEDAFRGSREEIRERQLDALPYVETLRDASAPVLDLGCGRGEWVELLRDRGIPAYGVDLNDAMLGAGRDRGLDLRQDDAVGHLESLPEASLSGITAFHFVEHIPLPTLVRLLDGALLALRPGGVLVFETPNPTNVIVGSAAFYLDPTHLRPVHPDFLRFLVESRGFTDVQVHYVHPNDSVLRDLPADPAGAASAHGTDTRAGRVLDAAEWALLGPMDYHVVARRPEVA